MANRLLVLCCFTLLACSSSSKKETSESGNGDPVRAIDAAASDKNTPSGWKARLSDIDKLVYRFQDSSVPPQYHRSFTITVTAAEISKVVDSYGDIISEQANAITESQFRTLLDTLSAHDIEFITEPRDELDGCAGGTSDSLALYVKGEVLLEGSASSCGGTVAGTLRGNVKEVARTAASLLLPSTDAPRAD